MNRLPSAVLAVLTCSHTSSQLAAVELRSGPFTVQYERTFRGDVTILAATDRYLFLSDAASDETPSSVVRLLVCNRLTGELLHQFPGPVSRRPRVSGFGIPLTSPPVLLDDGFVFLSADWHLRRIRLGEAGPPVSLWDLDVPAATRRTPRLSDDMGYLMPAVTRCGGTLLFTFNSAPAPDKVPLEITVVAVDVADGQVRWMRSLGSTDSMDRSPTCVPAGPDQFHVATATGDIQTFSTEGVRQYAFRPAEAFAPEDVESRRAGASWELQRLDGSRLLVFSGESPEFGRAIPSPLSCVEVGPGGGMRLLWGSSKVHGSVAPAAAGTNLYLRSSAGLTAFSLETGRELWSHSVEDRVLNCAWSPPVIHDGIVYLATLDRLVLFRDGPERSPVGVVEFDCLLSDFSALLIHDRSLYVAAADTLYALELPLFR